MKHLSILCIFTLFTTSVAHAQVSTFADGIAVGGTSLSTGLILDVTGKIGASELCDANGANCSTVTNIYNAVTGGGIGGTGSGNYIPRFTNGTTLGNSVIRQSGDGNIGIGVAGMANSDTNASKLRVNGNLKVDGANLFLRGHQFNSNNAEALYLDSNHSSVTFLELRDAQNTRYGRLHGDGNATSFGLLDRDANWGLRLVADSHVELRDNNEVTFNAGQGGVSGNYGTVSTQGVGKGNWEGYSI